MRFNKIKITYNNIYELKYYEIFILYKFNSVIKLKKYIFWKL